MSQVKIYGFTGIVKAGKDTASLALASTKENVHITAFAYPLKEACKILYNFTDDQLHNDIIKEVVDERYGKSPRQILQWFGTDVIRNQIGKDFFIYNMNERIKKSKADCIIISDVRFDNEAEYIKSLGGKVIKIVRPGAETTEHNKHATEQGISSHLIDCQIINSSGADFAGLVISTVANLEKDK